METGGGPPRCYDSIENGNVHGPDFSPQEAEKAASGPVAARDLPRTRLV